jgi:DNA-directed RNA polymerase specialized sigma24 family protein
MPMGRTRGARAAEIEAIYRDRFPVFPMSINAALCDGHEALGVVQEGFSRALRRRRSFRGDGTLEGWIWRIVLNVAADRGRARGKAPRPGTEERAATDPAAPDDVIRRQLRASRGRGARGGNGSQSRRPRPSPFWRWRSRRS